MSIKKMEFIKFFLLSLLALSILCHGNGCATLPNVSKIIDKAPTAQNPPQIVSANGLLSQRESAAVMDVLRRSVPPTDILERHTAVMESVTNSSLSKGNKIALLTDGPATYAAMLEAMQNAKDHINLKSYIIEDDLTGRKFADLLLQKQREGVQVNLIYDSVGSINTPNAFFRELRDSGIEVVEFNPVNPLKARGKWGLTHRTHRKILVVDGKVAIMGGVNISKVYSSNPLKWKHSKIPPIHWRDTNIQIEGPAVAELQRLFLDTWLQQKGPKLSERNYFPDQRAEGRALARVVGSTPGQSNRIPFIGYVSAITFAEHSIYMTNAYFIPDRQIITALTDAAERGVDVKIILPRISDSQLALHAQRYHYSELLKSGVKIFEHDTSLLHAKTAVIDSIWSTVGSTNMDSLSMLHNDEVNTFILSREFAAEMEEMFAMDLADSRQIHWDEWKNRPLIPRSKGWFVNLFSRWL